MNSAKNKTGAEITVSTLIRHGVRVIFGYPGGAIMPIYDALVPYMDELRHILVRHEQGGIHAAEGYARVTGTTGVCFATSGPGATNLITGLADALMDSVPLVCVTGQVNSAFLGTDAFQETDVISLAIPVSKWCYQCTTADEIEWAINKGFKIANSGRPGPVLIDITKDAQIAVSNNPKIENSNINFNDDCSSTKQIELVDSLNSYQEVAKIINQTDEVLVLVGNGVRLANASLEVRKFLESGKIPFASTLHGLSVLPRNHPLSFGMLGMHGNYAPNIMTNNAKLIIALGMRFDDRVTGDVKRYGINAKIVHVEIDPSQVNKAVKVDFAFIESIKDFCGKITPFIKQRVRTEWFEDFQKLQEEEVSQVISKECERTSGQLSMGEVVLAISKEADKNAVVVTDVGQHQMSVARYFEFTGEHQLITSGGLGTMGYCVPAALGAACADPSRQVLAITGDGGFQMTLQELATIAQEEVPVKIIILNNSFLGMVRQWQELFFDKRYSFVALKNPDFVALSNSFGIKGYKVDSRENLQDALKEAFLNPGPALIEIVVETEQNVFPMIPAGKSVSEISLKM